MPTADITHTSGKPFCEQLDYYLSLLTQDEIVPRQVLQRLVDRTNQRLPTTQPDEPQDLLTLPALEQARNDEQSLSVAVATTILDELQPTLGIYGDMYEDSLAAAQKAAHTNGTARPSIEQTMATAKAEHYANRTAEIRAIEFAEKRRQQNPGKDASKPSFAEMIEASYEQKEDFVAFLFDRVMPTWNNISQVALCAHIGMLNAKKDDLPKATITDTVLSNWHNRVTKPERKSIDVICKAFDIVPKKNEVMAEHEVMLWKIIDGRPFQWKGMEGDDALEMAIAETKETGETGKLVKELIDASGVKFERMQEVLKVQQVTGWKKGSKIADVDVALNFLSLVNPDFHSESLSQNNRDLLSLITGRTFDVTELIANANEATNPGGALFVSMTGRNGMVTITPADLEAAFKTAGHDISSHKLRKMRKSTPQRGGIIYEGPADVIVAETENAARPWATKGVIKAFTDEQKADLVDTLTGCKHPKKLLAEAVSGELPVGEMVRKTYERRGLNQQGKTDSFCAETGLNAVSNFVLGKSNMDHQTAKRLADWFADKYDFTTREQQQLMALATGTSLDQTPDEVLQEVIDGKTPRVDGLIRLYDMSGYSRPDMAEKAGIDASAITYSTQTNSGARIMSERSNIESLGTLIGISEGRLQDFIDTFDGHTVTRQKAILNDSAPAGTFVEQTTLEDPSESYEQENNRGRI